MVADNDVDDTIKLEPDAGLVKSLGAHHTLESAIADMADNCLDADADRISLRLLTKDDSLAQIEIVDNGKGMDESAIDKAMTLGHRREYGSGRGMAREQVRPPHRCRTRPARGRPHLRSR
ncbi:ATP-binding protein [Rhodococcus oryzae]|uniref:ATP-binding protein n=1 Tax=Rhodococcus oryzae TaxID=2571143 RepID=UPI0037BBE014